MSEITNPRMGRPRIGEPSVQLDAKKVKHILIDTDITQKELAEICGLTNGYLSMVVRGMMVKQITAQNIATALNVPLEDILK